MLRWQTSKVIVLKLLMTFGDGGFNGVSWWEILKNE
jgi:hypothetical protein